MSSLAPSLDSLDDAFDNENVNKLSREEVTQFFAEETLFATVGEAVRERILDVARQTVLEKDAKLFTMGQRCESLHFVVLGTGALVKSSPEGRQRVLHRALPGEIVAAVPFFDGKGYPATFTAETDCLVASLSRDELLSLLRSDPRLALALVGDVVGRLRMMTEIVEQLSFEDTTHRLWSFLVDGSKATGEDEGEFPRIFESLPTRERIADSIGSVREVVSRRLSALASSGHVRIERRQLTLLKPLD